MKKSALIITAVVVILIGVRLYLPFWITGYVNRVLDDIPGYHGSITDVDLNLYRGAYKIKNLKVEKIDSTARIPFVDIADIDLSVQWRALLHGRVVGEIAFIKPVINFVASSDTAAAQSGTETDWTKPVKDLIPLQINRLVIRDGKLVYHDFSRSPKIDLTMDSLQAEAANLNNAIGDTVSLPSTITAAATSIGGGKLSLNTRANVLKEVPDFDLNAQIEGIALPALNDFSRAYAKLDFEKGTISIYSEMAVADGKFTGYVKPVMHGIKLVDFSENKKKPLKLIWESIAGAVTKLFENHSKDQFATKVPISGDLNDPNTKMWPTIGNVFKNAFIRAFTPNTDNDISIKDVKDKK